MRTLGLMFLLSLLSAGAYALTAGPVLWKCALVWLGSFAALNVLYVLFWVIVAATVDDTKPLKKQRELCRFGCANIAGWLSDWAGLRVTVTGEELLPREGRFMLVCNHRSMFDPIVGADRLRQYNISYISKPSNLKLPFIGKLAYGAGFLPIDRSNDREALKTILLAADYLKRDLCSMAVYPEGTRSRDGKLLPFHAGSFKIAQKAGVPLVIAAIDGTEQVHRRFPFRRTRVRLQILELLPAERVKAMGTRGLSDYSRARMAAALGEEETT